jgi:hypothetical protein
MKLRELLLPAAIGLAGCGGSIEPARWDADHPCPMPEAGLWHAEGSADVIEGECDLPDWDGDVFLSERASEEALGDCQTVEVLAYEGVCIIDVRLVCHKFELDARYTYQDARTFMMEGTVTSGSCTAEIVIEFRHR